jgi:hypothetical protein
MSSEILTKIYFEFVEENKEKVLNKIRESDALFENYKLTDEDKNFIEIELNNSYNPYISESDLSDFKGLCYYINVQEYEALEYSENNFIWEKEE